MTLPVALDAMGGDHAPQAIVAGARLAAAEGRRVVLVGDPGQLGDTGGIEVVPATEVIEMSDEPGRALRAKRDASVLRAAELVRDGAACALVGMGNTGAAMGAAILRMRRLRGIKRPALAAVVRSPGVPRSSVLLDVGANIDVAPDLLVRFAEMGVVFARSVGLSEEPTVGLLTIGEESNKGNGLVQAASELLAGGALGAVRGRYAGHVEGRDLIAGVVDVIVCDGFVGNVALKAMEGTSAWIAELVRGRLGAAAGELADVWPQLAPEHHNGALLLGVDGVCVVGHGASGPVGVARAIAVASEAAEGGVVDALRRSFALIPP